MASAEPKLCDHKRKFPCGQCTYRLFELLHASPPNSRLWLVKVDQIEAALRQFPDLSVCGNCGDGSTVVSGAERCNCKGGKSTAYKVAEARCDAGAVWLNEDVVGPGGQLLQASDPSWMRNNPLGASKESVYVLNLIKSKMR